MTIAAIAAAIFFLSAGRVDQATADKWAAKIVQQCDIESHREIRHKMIPVDPLDIVATFRGESNFIPTVVNPRTKATGLGQVMRFHRKKHPKDLLDPEINIEYSVRIYSEFLHICSTDKKGRARTNYRGRAVSAYNGQGCVNSPWSRYIMQFRKDLEQFEPRIAGSPARCPTTLLCRSQCPS